MKTEKNPGYFGVLLLILVGARIHVGVGEGLVAAQSSPKNFTPSKKLQLIAAAREGETKGTSLLEWSIKNISRKDHQFSRHLCFARLFVRCQRSGGSCGVAYRRRATKTRRIVVCITPDRGDHSSRRGSKKTACPYGYL